MSTDVYVYTVGAESVVLYEDVLECQIISGCLAITKDKISLYIPLNKLEWFEVERCEELPE